MTILSSISLVSAVLAMILGVVVVQKSPRSKTQFIYFVLSTIIAVVAFGEYGFRQSETIESARFWFGISELSPLIIPFITLFVGAYARYPFAKNTILIISLMFAPAILFCSLDLYSGVLSGIPMRTKWGWGQTYSPSITTHLFDFWSTSMLLAATYFAVAFYRSRTNRQERNQAKYVALAIAVMTGFTVVLDIGMPYFHIQLPEFATLGYVFANALIAYAIRYHRLFVLSPVVATATILETMSDALFLVLPDGKIAHVNKAARKLFAITGEGYRDKSLDDYFNCGEPFFGTAGNGTFRLTEEHFDTPAISCTTAVLPQKTLSIAGKSMVENNGVILGTVVTVRDITDRVKAENALKESYDLLEKRVRERTEELHTSNEALAEERERLAVTLRSIADGVITTDTRGNVSFINKGGELITGCISTDVSGQPVTTILKIRHPDLPNEFFDPVAATLADGKRMEFTTPLHLLTHTGAERRIIASVAPIRKSDGDILGTVIVFRDVTEQERIEEELFRAKRLESVAMLAGGIAHDFNNLLTSINNNLFMCKLAAQDPAAMTGCINEAEREILRAKRLAMQLLTFAQGGDPVLAVASPRTLIEDSIGFFMSGSRCSYEVHFDNDLMNIHVDRGMMEQVLSNLLINAEQSMPEGGTIDVSVQNVLPDRDKNRQEALLASVPSSCAYVKIVIRDYGTGIPEAIRDKIFDPFFSTKGKGRGLGLSIAQSIISKHGGTISLDPDLQQGTAMIILLPAVEQSTPEQLECTTQQRYPSHFEPRGQKILLMDDEKTIRNSTTKILEMMGYSVIAAANGEEAITRYKEALASGFLFDCVILDLTIPGGMGGLECLEQLKKIDRGVLAIVSSGYSNDPVMAKYGRYGFAGVLKKPFVIDQLDAIIQAVIEERCLKVNN